MPEHSARMTKNCKVIATCFAPREVRLEHARCGNPPGLFLHAQNFPDSDSVLELIQVVREFERTVDPGVECDTIIVNNDVGWTTGRNYLDSIHGTKTFAGVLRVVHRQNFGSSLGAYNHAYEVFGTEYAYWTFTEDDVLINGDRWLVHCRDAFEACHNAGFVAIQGLSSDWALHAHGGVGTTHVSILKAVTEAWGALPHRLENESQDEEGHTVFGEVLFTNMIHRLGFRLVTVEAKAPLYEFAYEHMMRACGFQVPTYQPRLVPRVLRKVSRVAGSWAERFEQ